VRHATYTGHRIGGVHAGDGAVRRGGYFSKGIGRTTYEVKFKIRYRDEFDGHWVTETRTGYVDAETVEAAQAIASERWPGRQQRVREESPTHE
jgi:hypothetical protein